MLADKDAAARRWVDRCLEVHPPTVAGQASLSLRAREWEEALPWCQRLALGDWPQLRADGLVGAGMALARLERHEEAELSLQQALIAAVNQAGRLASHYGLALLYREREDSARERAELELIACESPDFADVPRRLATLRAADPLTVLRGLEESLRGPAALDPDIPDNHPPQG
jgi:tetratricopeptide (TPR) repeat protein